MSYLSSVSVLVDVVSVTGVFHTSRISTDNVVSCTSCNTSLKIWVVRKIKKSSRIVQVWGYYLNLWWSTISVNELKLGFYHVWLTLACHWTSVGPAYIIGLGKMAMTVESGSSTPSFITAWCCSILTFRGTSSFLVNPPRGCSSRTGFWNKGGG